MDSLLADVRYAVRSLRNSPGFSLVALLTVALGVGANAAIFSLVNGVLLRPPAGVSQPSQLVTIYTSDYSSGDYGTSSYPDFEAIRADSGVLAGVAAYDIRQLALSVGDQAEMILGQLVSGDYFRVLGTSPAAGRLLAPPDAAVPGSEAVAVISYGLWRRRFAAAGSAVGSQLRINGHPFRIVGVAPEGFGGVLRGLVADVWIPVTMDPVLQPGSDDLTNLGSRGLLMVGRIRDGVSLEQVQARLSALARARFEQFPDYWRTVRGEGRRLTVLPESDTRVPPQARGIALGAVALLMSVVGLVLLIACANLANLLLARANRRRREIAVRLSLGASRRRLVRQLLVESVVLATMGGAAGLLVAQWISGALAGLRLPLPIPVRLDLGLDQRVLAFTLVISVATGLVFGLVPALKGSRPNLVGELKGETQAAGPGRSLSFRNALVVGQVAVSLLLLVAAALMLRSLARAQAVDPGFDPSNTVLMTFDLASNGYNEVQGRAFYDQLLARARALPRVETATLAQRVPLAGCCGRRGTIIEGYVPQPGESTEINWNVVGTDYFRTMRVPLIRGRDFAPADRAGAPLVALVNEAFARRYWPGQDPLGKRLGLSGSSGSFAEVVGLVRDGKYRSLGEDALPFMYVPFAQLYRSPMTLHVRTAGDPGALLAGLRDEVRRLAPGLPIINPTTLRDASASALLPHRLGAALLGLFGGLAALLAILGLYGVLAYSVSQRVREFGIRTALGAARRDVLAQVLREGMSLTAAGIVIGVALALGLTRLTTSFLFGVSPLDPLSFGAVGALVIAATLVASYLPARRAMRIPPMEALRHE